MRPERRLKTRQTARSDALVGQHRVAEGEHRVDRIGRRTALPPVGVELGRDLFGAPLEHAAEVPEVDGCGVALVAAEFVHCRGALGGLQCEEHIARATRRRLR